jgi:hypothetical protein
MTTPESRLPAPEQLVIVPLDEMELAEEIECYIDFVDNKGRSVHLNTAFVKHFLKRDDRALPIVTSIAQTPIILRDGIILSGRWLNRKYGIVFRVPAELEALLPDRSGCTPVAIAKAMRFLTDGWLCDVAADYAGKCILIACLLTILERALLPERPAFFVTAGKRGGGKTTTLHMISMAALGIPASAAAWSTIEEERRKSLFAHLGLGLPFLIWDNIARGSTISCPSIERSLTTEFYTDRVLGVSDTKTVPTYTVQAFTGNNIAPRGDLASRSLTVRLAVDRPDPENREFKHTDAVTWTEAHRGQILQAAYTILLGNPRRDGKKHSPPTTRFKIWWDVVGSAIEYAAALVADEDRNFVADPNPACAARKIAFKDLFLAGEADEEETSSLAIAIDTIRSRWPYGAKASDIAAFAAETGESGTAFRSALELASSKGLPVVTATAVTWRLKAIIDSPVVIDGYVFALRYLPDKAKSGGTFRAYPVEMR